MKINYTVSLEIIMSNKPRIENDIPIAGPLTKASNGFEKSMND